MRTQSHVFESESEIEAAVQSLETCILERGAFTHRLHLAVAAWYVSRDPATALARLRAALLGYTRHHGVAEKYHETITRFWLHLVGAELDSMPPEAALHKRVNRLLEKLDDKELLFVYYSRERVFSAEARAGWVEPDLQPLPRAEGQRAGGMLMREPR
jgi:hypothetical protein